MTGLSVTVETLLSSALRVLDEKAQSLAKPFVLR